MAPDSGGRKALPEHYVCPSCHLYLLWWDAPTRTLEMFQKIGIWSDFWTGDVRLICQYCLGATDIVPQQLVELLYHRFGLGTPPPPAEARPREPGER